jgi:hypothetical protein
MNGSDMFAVQHLDFSAAVANSYPLDRIHSSLTNSEFTTIASDINTSFLTVRAIRPAFLIFLDFKTLITFG